MQDRGPKHYSLNTRVDKDVKQSKTRFLSVTGNALFSYWLVRAKAVVEVKFLAIWTIITDL